MPETTDTNLTQAQLDYFAREKRFNDAVSLTRPDRVPLASLVGMFMTRYSGLTNAEAMYDYEKMAEGWKSSTRKLNFDLAGFPSIVFPGRVMEKLGLRTFKWPGHELDDNLPYQFVEKEYMLADEYDELLRDPGDFVIRKMMPRMADTLEPFSMLPPLHWLSSGYTLLMLFSTIVGLPPFTAMLKKILEVGEEMNRFNEAQAKLTKDLAEMGYPITTTTTCQAPFDWISDMFRGLRGSMLDMFQRPDKLKAAIELFTPFVIQSGIMAAKHTGNKRIFIPLHRGSAGFMSNKQFEEFYWPGLKQICLAFIDAGLLPMPFFEGDYTPRLKFLAELPPGKVACHFDQADKKKVKEILCDIIAFWGNVPASMLVTGRPEQVRDYVKELIDTFGDNGGIIIDGAVDGVPPDSKFENVEAMVETVFEYGVY